jgi:hypothetical protein
MMETTRLRKFTLGAVACFAAGCASTGITVEKPGVSLRNVEVAKIDLDHQTFVLDFDVINPNPFPLPIRSVSYGVELDGFRFASGETLGEFTVPALRHRCALCEPGFVSQRRLDTAQCRRAGCRPQRLESRYGYARNHGAGLAPVRRLTT